MNIWKQGHLPNRREAPRKQQAFAAYSQQCAVSRRTSGRASFRNAAGGLDGTASLDAAFEKLNTDDATGGIYLCSKFAIYPASFLISAKYY
jgi:hypothetical protein